MKMVTFRGVPSDGWSGREELLCLQDSRECPGGGIDRNRAKYYRIPVPLHPRSLSSSILQRYHSHCDQQEVYEDIAARVTSRIRNRRQPPPVPIIRVEIHAHQALPLLLILLLPPAGPLQKSNFVFKLWIIHEAGKIGRKSPVAYFYVRASPEVSFKVRLRNQQSGAGAVIRFSINSRLFVHVSGR